MGFDIWLLFRPIRSIRIIRSICLTFHVLCYTFPVAYNQHFYYYEAPDQPKIPEYSWPGFPKRANSLISGYVRDLETLKSDFSPDYGYKRAKVLRLQISLLSLEFNIETRGINSRLSYNTLADAFLGKAITLFLDDEENDLGMHFVELSEKLRALAKTPREPQVTSMYPEIRPEQLRTFLGSMSFENPHR